MGIFIICISSLVDPHVRARVLIPSNSGNPMTFTLSSTHSVLEDWPECRGQSACLPAETADRIQHEGYQMCSLPRQQAGPEDLVR